MYHAGNSQESPRYWYYTTCHVGLKCPTFSEGLSSLETRHGLKCALSVHVFACVGVRRPRPSSVDSRMPWVDSCVLTWISPLHSQRRAFQSRTLLLLDMCSPYTRLLLDIYSLYTRLGLSWQRCPPRGPQDWTRSGERGEAAVDALAGWDDARHDNH